MAWAALGVLGAGCAPRVRFASDPGRYGGNAKPKVVAPKPGAAVLVGSASSKPGREQRSGSRGIIVAIDGRKLKQRHAASEVSVAAGCHIVEAKFIYKVERADSLTCDLGVSVGSGLAGLPIPANCANASEFRSGIQRFAISIESGKRYEFTAHITDGEIHTYFAEVDPALGTVARHVPVKPGTRTCAPGVPVGSTSRDTGQRFYSAMPGEHVIVPGYTGVNRFVVPRSGSTSTK